MATVIVTSEARAEFLQLPQPLRPRVLQIFRRLEKWPAVSGAKPLRGSLAGSYRIRTGDYRVIFSVQDDTVIVGKIGYRGDVYD